jgi:hypothetical protein
VALPWRQKRFRRLSSANVRALPAYCRYNPNRGRQVYRSGKANELRNGRRCEFGRNQGDNWTVRDGLPSADASTLFLSSSQHRMTWMAKEFRPNGCSDSVEATFATVLILQLLNLHR